MARRAAKDEALEVFFVGGRRVDANAYSSAGRGMELAEGDKLQFVIEMGIGEEPQLSPIFEP